MRPIILAVCRHAPLKWKPSPGSVSTGKPINLAVSRHAPLKWNPSPGSVSTAKLKGAE